MNWRHSGFGWKDTEGPMQCRSYNRWFVETLIDLDSWTVPRPFEERTSQKKILPKHHPPILQPLCDLNIPAPARSYCHLITIGLPKSLPWGTAVLLNLMCIKSSRSPYIQDIFQGGKSAHPELHLGTLPSAGRIKDAFRIYLLTVSVFPRQKKYCKGCHIFDQSAKRSKSTGSTDWNCELSC